MGRIGAGPDLGDGPFPWTCPRCNYPNPAGASNCMDCSYGGGTSYSSSSSSSRCTCECPVHGKGRQRRERVVKEKPPTKRQKAQIKKFLEGINKRYTPAFTTSGDARITIDMNGNVTRTKAKRKIARKRK